jgi:hypothetical protein
VIGEGEGRNWWCVLYPALCLTDADCTATEQLALPLYEGSAEAKAEAAPTEEAPTEEALVTAEPNDVVFESAVLNWLKETF